MNSLHHRGHNLFNGIRIFHQCAALPVSGYLRHRTSHINIENVKRLILQHARGFCHDVRVGSEQLKTDRPVLRNGFHQIFRIFIMIGYRPGAYHLGNRKICTEAAAEQTKWQVSYPCHRTQY